MKYFAFLFFILNSFISIGQYTSTGGLSNVLGEFVGYGITTDLSGNMLICGIGGTQLDFPGSDGQILLTCEDDTDGIVCKLDPNGMCLWAASFGSNTNNSEWANSIVTDNQENVYVAGSFIGSCDFDPSENETIINGGTGDGYLIKLNANGELLWERTISGSGVDRAQSVTISPNGEILVSGIMGSNGYIGDPSHPMLPGETGTFIASFDDNGNVNWHKSLVTTGSSNIVALACDASGNIYGTGLFSNTMDLDPSEEDFILDELSSQDGCFFKLDPSGNFIWGGQFSSTGQDWGYDIVVNENNEAFVVGVFQDDMTISNGTNDVSVSSTTGASALLMKLTSDGEVAWAYPIEGEASTRGQCVELDANGNVWFGGFFNGYSDFDPSIQVSPYTSLGGMDAFVVELDSDGNFLNAFQFGGVLGQQFRCIYRNSQNELYLTGVTSGDCDFDITENTDIQNASEKSAFYLKIVSTIQSVEADVKDEKVLFYPNLLNENRKEIRLNVTGNFSLYNSSGMLIENFGWRVKGSAITLQLPSGIYYVKMNSTEGQRLEKLLVH